MKIPYRTIGLVLVFGFLVFSIDTYAQTSSMRRIERRSHRAERRIESSKSQKVQKAEKKAAKQKEKQKKAYERARKKELKHRYGIQTPETKERMNETHKQADQYNNSKKNREPFFKRLFKLKRPKS
jgi:Spy/CpxP family protein refolding chaperone